MFQFIYLGNVSNFVWLRLQLTKITKFISSFWFNFQSSEKIPTTDLCFCRCLANIENIIVIYIDIVPDTILTYWQKIILLAVGWLYMYALICLIKTMCHQVFSNFIFKSTVFNNSSVIFNGIICFGHKIIHVENQE